MWPSLLEPKKGGKEGGGKYVHICMVKYVCMYVCCQQSVLYVCDDGGVIVFCLSYECVCHRYVSICVMYVCVCVCMVMYVHNMTCCSRYLSIILCIDCACHVPYVILCPHLIIPKCAFMTCLVMSIST